MKIVVAALLLIAAPLNAAEKDLPIDKATRDQAIARALQLLDTEYVFPDGAKKLTQALRDKQQQGAYDKITSSTQFAQALTNDLHAAVHDLHLRVGFSEQPLPPDRERGKDEHPTHDQLERMRRHSEPFNFGFVKVEIIDGNIGYLRLDGFDMAYLGGDTAAAAMAFVANADALIFDLRENHGGDPSMVQLLLGYLFEGDPMRFNDFVYRDTSRTEQYWSLPWVPGKRFLDKPVYVLTSHQTFSCGEEFTYDLQTQKRATIVGETTGGGAHPVAFYRLTEHLGIGVPFARALNPVKHDDWEGRGVIPDVAVAADKALAKAKILAAQRIAREKPRYPRQGEDLKRVQAEAEAELKK